MLKRKRVKHTIKLHFNNQIKPRKINQSLKHFQHDKAHTVSIPEIDEAMNSDVHCTAFDKMGMLSCRKGDNRITYLSVHLIALQPHYQPDTSDTPASSQVTDADSASPIGAGLAAAAAFHKAS